jgi:hypothetical protein
VWRQSGGVGPGRTRRPRCACCGRFFAALSAGARGPRERGNCARPAAVVARKGSGPAGGACRGRGATLKRREARPRAPPQRRGTLRAALRSHLPRRSAGAPRGAGDGLASPQRGCEPRCALPIPRQSDGAAIPAVRSAPAFFRPRGAAGTRGIWAQVVAAAARRRQQGRAPKISPLGPVSAVPLARLPQGYLGHGSRVAEHRTSRPSAALLPLCCPRCQGTDGQGRAGAMCGRLPPERAPPLPARPARLQTVGQAPWRFRVRVTSRARASRRGRG